MLGSRPKYLLVMHADYNPKYINELPNHLACTGWSWTVFVGRPTYYKIVKWNNRNLYRRGSDKIFDIKK